jgi:acetylornithine deacetylase
VDVLGSLAKHVDRDDLVQRLRTLVRIPSVTGTEDAAQAQMANFLQELGGEVDAWRPDVPALRKEPNFPTGKVLEPRLNVAATFRGHGGGPTLVLNGHMDTVTAGDERRWTHPPFAAEVVDGRLYGRGACDMKGGLVAILGALRAIREAGLRLGGSVVVQSVIGEEDSGLGTFAALHRGHRGDAVIVCEPTRLAVAPAQAGMTVFRITVEGRAAHASVRAEGVSAFERFRPIYDALVALEARRNRALRHPLFEDQALPWALNVGMVQAGSWPSIVPEVLTAEGRIGVAIGEPIAEARRQLEQAVGEAAQADAWLAAHPPTVEWIGLVCQPAETRPEHPLVRTLAAAVEEVTGRPAALTGVPYGSDLRLFTVDFGIPGALFGPGDIRVAHFTDEFLPLAELEAAALTLAQTIVRFGGVA